MGQEHQKIKIINFKNLLIWRILKNREKNEKKMF